MIDKIAQWLHDFRVFPRFTLMWYLWLVTKVVYWYQEGTADQWLLTTVVGMSAIVIPVYNYSKSGSDKPVPFDK